MGKKKGKTKVKKSCCGKYKKKGKHCSKCHLLNKKKCKLLTQEKKSAKKAKKKSKKKKKKK
ncbi:MAG TPA: hypothetical protein ENK96_11150 [Desulfobulbaceae bacterium]|nr:hypothetical protein [Desulfobulbaceae bacterium]